MITTFLVLIPLPFEALSIIYVKACYFYVAYNIML